MSRVTARAARSRLNSSQLPSVTAMYATVRNIGRHGRSADRLRDEINFARHPLPSIDHSSSMARRAAPRGMQMRRRCPVGILAKYAGAPLPRQPGSARRSNAVEAILAVAPAVGPKATLVVGEKEARPQFVG